MRRASVAAGLGGAAMVLVGGSVAASGTLADAPLWTAQAVRYAVAALLLLRAARLCRVRLMLPRGREWLWLLGVAVTGLVLFNVALVHGSRHAEPAVLGVGVACVPILLAMLGPIVESRPPTRRAVVAAPIVTAGAALVEGAGRSDAIGYGWAAVVLVCEAAFTLLAIPVLGRHGPWGVSIHATWLAAAMFAALGVVVDGPAGITRFDTAVVATVGYLAVAVTAVAFLLWYTCVRRLGAGRAGLLTGIAPIAAAGTGIALGGPAPAYSVWIGIAAVAAGLAVGIRPEPAGELPQPAMALGNHH